MQQVDYKKLLFVILFSYVYICNNQSYAGSNNDARGACYILAHYWGISGNTMKEKNNVSCHPELTQEECISRCTEVKNLFQSTLIYGKILLWKKGQLCDGSHQILKELSRNMGPPGAT